MLSFVLCLVNRKIRCMLLSAETAGTSTSNQSQLAAWLARRISPLPVRHLHTFHTSDGSHGVLSGA